jgi:hypothetical protein
LALLVVIDFMRTAKKIRYRCAIHQILFIISAISYVQPVEAAAFAAELSKTAYTTQGKWQLVWGPAWERTWDNVVFIARQTGTSIYAVVIRGTDYTPLGMDTLGQAYEDLAVGQQVPFGCGSPVGASIANGTLLGLHELTNQKGWSQIDPRVNQTLLDFLIAAAPETIYVTGHSLGGCLSTVLAPWIKFQLNQGGITPAIIAYTFAAPSAGNLAFADWYTNNSGITSYRFFNTIDLVPMAWADLAGMKLLFSPNPGASISLKLIIDGISLWLSDRDKVIYVQPNGPGNPLKNNPTPGQNWFDEVGTQHAHNTYLTLLGATPVDF